MATLQSLGTVRLRLRLGGEDYQETLHAVQGDTGRVLEFDVLDGDGTVVTDLTGVTPVLFVRRPDGKEVGSATGEIVDGVIRITIPSNLLAYAGEAKAQIQLLDSANQHKLHDHLYRLQIEESLEAEASPAENLWFSLVELTEAIAEVNLLVEQYDTDVAAVATIRDDVTTKHSEVTTMHASLQDVFDTEQARRTAESARISAETDRVEAENNRRSTFEQLEEEYAPKLTEVTAQLAHTGDLAGDAYSKNTVISPKSPTGKGFIVFIDDDARREVLTKLKPISDEYGIPFTLAVPVRNSETTPDQDLTPEELRGLQAQGWEMASQSYNHIGLHDQPKDVVEFELGESKKVLQSWGLEINNYIAPYGHIEQPMIREIASKYYNTAGGVGGLTNKRPVQNFRLHRVPLGSFQANANESTAAFYKAQVDDAFSNDGLLIFMTHAHQPEHDAIQDGYLRETIEYAQSLGVPIGNMQEGFERYGNLLEIEGRSFIGSDGKPFGNLKPEDPVDMVVYGFPGENPTDVMMATTPENIWNNFPNKIVHVTYSFANNQNFPVSKAGTLITHSLTTVDNMWQEWHPYGKRNEVYYRWAISNGIAWSDFVQSPSSQQGMTVMAFPGINPSDINLNTTPSAIWSNFPNKIVHVTYTPGDNQDFPISKSGRLITHSLITPDNMWQEWRPYGMAHKVYYRNALPDGTGWTTFKLSTEA